MKALLLILFPTLAAANFVCGTEDSVIEQKAPVFESMLIVGKTEQGGMNIWSHEERQNLTYCISDRFGKHKADVIRAFEQVSQEWMAHANVQFRYLAEEDNDCESDNPKVIFRVKYANSGRVPYAARAFFPDYAPEDRNMWFKKTLFKASFNDLLGVTRHEFGHVLGFRHEHIHPDNEELCEEDDRFEPVTDYDHLSVMSYYQCGGKNFARELSKLDKLGAALIYPR